MDEHGGEEARHRAAVTDEEAVAAPLQLEPEPPAARPRAWSTIVWTRDISSSVSTGEHSVAPGCEEIGPAGEVVDGRPEPADRGARPSHGELGLDP